MTFNILNEPLILTADQIDFYHKNQFIKIKSILPAEIITYFNEVISTRVDAMNQEKRPLAERSTYGKAFLQLMNLWRADEAIKPLVFSKRIASVAAALMQVF